MTGVLLKLSGAASKSTITGDDGIYSLGNVPAGVNYTLTPSKAGHAFNPAQQTINNLSSSGHQGDFTALFHSPLDACPASADTG